VTENSAGNQRGRPFRKGQSGNPAGKPKGARHKTTLLAEKLMQDDAEAVVKAVVNAAKGGDMAAARLVLDRIAPARRDNPVAFTLPAVTSAAGAANAIGSILGAVAAGELSPSEGAEVAKLLDAFIRISEATEFERRLQALEQNGASDVQKP
jgi:uncharacterized protein DUF5681